MAKKGEKQPVKASAGNKRLSLKLPRQRRATRFQKRKFTKKTIRSYSPVPGSFKLTGQVFRIFKKHWKVLGGITTVYLILNIVFASGLSNVSGAFDVIKLNLQLQGTHFLNALGGFSSLIGSAGSSTSGSASAFQSVLFVLESLVIIWALRHLLANKAIGVKEAYYLSMTPLIPFLLVIFVMFLQLLPLTIGSAIIAAVFTSLFQTSALAVGIMILSIILLAVWSIYMLSGSVFALYIVTLPNMLPRDALRSAKNLVKFRRWGIVRRLIFLPLFLILAMALVIVPLILYADSLVVPVFYFLSMLAILFLHTYLYSLYRGLLE